MADFCKQCSLEIFQEDFRELAGLMAPDKYTESVGAGALCEGCGPTVVDIDGQCIAAYCELHGAALPQPQPKAGGEGS